MADIRTRLRQTHDDIVPPSDVMGTLTGRRKRLENRKRDRRRKIGSLVIGIAIVALGVGVVVHEIARPTLSTSLAGDDPIPVILADARLAPGPHLLSVAGMNITFDVPEGWRGSEQGVVDSENGGGGPNGAALTFWTVSNVYTDPCHWHRSAARPPIGGSVNELVAALATQKRHPSGDRIKLEVAGYDATELRMTIPEDLELAACDEGDFHSWQSPQGEPSHAAPGQVDQLFVLDVDDTRLVIDASYFPGTPQNDRNALFDMVRSIRFI